VQQRESVDAAIRQQSVNLAERLLKHTILVGLWQPVDVDVRLKRLLLGVQTLAVKQIKQQLRKSQGFLLSP
jgi:hypothetical protein